ncbi:MAG: hypothetical protein ACKOS8_07255, partial [Gemmataceae bacterium]
MASRLGTTRNLFDQFIQAGRSAKVQQLANGLGITQKGVEWHLRLLQAGGELRREGPAKGGRWL